MPPFLGSAVFFKLRELASHPHVLTAGALCLLGSWGGMRYLARAPTTGVIPDGMAIPYPGYRGPSHNPAPCKKWDGTGQMGVKS